MAKFAKHRALAAVLFTVVLAGCATAPTAAPRETEYARHAAELVAANAAYEATMIAAGQRNAQETLSDDGLAKVAAAGRLVQAALRAAQADLEAYRAGAPAEGVSVAMAVLEAVVAEMQRAAGVGP